MNRYSPHIRTRATTRSIMGDVLIALTPALIGSVIFFGIRALLLTAVSAATCMAAEALWQICHKKPVTALDLSAAVTGVLIAFNVSSTTPVWVVMLADVFAIILIKQFFGGIGSNVVNPALMGRLFIMLVYPAKMMSYVTPMNVDVVSSATILSALKNGKEIEYTLMDAFIGKVPGALGETSALLLLIGFIYLIIRKEVNWMASAGFFGTVLILSLIFGGSPMYQLLSGGLVLGGCFMLTDYNFTSKSGKLLYGIVAGVFVAAIRLFGSLPEGVCYGILAANCMVVLLEKVMSRHVYGVN